MSLTPKPPPEVLDYYALREERGRLDQGLATFFTTVVGGEPPSHGGGAPALTRGDGVLSSTASGGRIQVDAEDILDGLIRGALGGRRKRSRGALRSIGGAGSLINARNLLAAAGVAWGLYEVVSQQKASAPVGAPGGSTTPPLSPVPRTAPPPLPGAAAAGAFPEHVLRLVRLTVSAARADGDLALDERGVILEQARRVGAEAPVRAPARAGCRRGGPAGERGGRAHRRRGRQAAVFLMTEGAHVRRN